MRRSLFSRLSVAAAALSLIALSCGSGQKAAGCEGGTVCIDALAGQGTRVDLLQAQEALPTGDSVFTFGMVTKQGGVLTGGSPRVWIGRTGRSRPLGPFPATFYRFTPNHEDKSPRSPLTGFYAVPVSLPAAGTWSIATVATVNGSRLVGLRSVTVNAKAGPAQIGSRAVSVQTPVAATETARKRICTRKPPDPMHSISLDRALKNGKPTVVTFATPLLCESQLCGPVVDEQLLVFDRIGPKRANFIHVEEFPPGPDLRPDPHTIPPYWKKWGFQTEPWTVIIDGDGIVRARFEGPVVASLIEEALKPLL